MTSPRCLTIPVSLGILLGGLAGPRPVAARDGEPFSPNPAIAAEIELSFSLPGARSLAMGGAFLGQADDATAAYANPAGLVRLREPEVSLELRSFPATVGFLAVPGDSGPAERSVEIGQETLGLSFASYVYPRDRWTLAGYHYQLADYQLRGGPEQSTRAQVRGYGLAGAWRFDGGLSLGAVLIRYEGTFESVSACRTLTGSCAGTVIHRGDDSDLVANLGLLWQPGTRWSFGAVYRRGPRLGVTTLRDEPGAPGLRETDRFPVRVPDVAGLGFAVRPSSRLVLNLDWVRVAYSQPLDEVGERRVTSASGEPLGEFRLQDADEFHVGLEYSFWNAKGSPALRFGAWWDPDHRVRFEPERGLDANPGPAGEPSDALTASALERLWPGGSDRLHVSAGFGLVVNRRMQIDAAADLSKDTEAYSLSALVRF